MVTYLWEGRGFTDKNEMSAKPTASKSREATCDNLIQYSIHSQDSVWGISEEGHKLELISTHWP
jgi:hypothetical protein